MPARYWYRPRADLIPESMKPAAREYLGPCRGIALRNPFENGAITVIAPAMGRHATIFRRLTNGAKREETVPEANPCTLTMVALTVGTERPLKTAI